jgi:diacylglycerol kinase family enzyme
MSLVLLNRRAGNGRAARLEAPLRQALADGPAVVAPASIDEARDRVAALPAGSRVIVVGGDGTLHGLLPALLKRQCELALLPAGSGDDTARALGLHGLDWRRALQHALHAPARRMDLGEVQTAHECSPFISSLCAGFDAAVAGRAQRLPSVLQGRPRYLWATLREIVALRLAQVRVELDGHTWHTGPALFASTLNTASYGGGMPAMPGARPDDGALDLLLAGRFGRVGVLRMLPALLAGRHLGRPQVFTGRFATLRLRADTPLPLAADGEPLAAAAEVSVRVLPSALAVVAAQAG